ncbi:helix-turn-helix domain-containing protein [Actinomadura bangladeshensis]|jgi:transcriptional regulator with XRE-family HTH domain|uniref:Helix-turn-helix domain-containing protein n=1 Tax=Actinomadura bangladeshensis TaxID=453573 RepID=A0A6L9QHL3_9ACTN|nr:helix-turn-helix transcriptional regulator [Actinomadura bangladeshensis]NEA24991.1 helix-turn-helix domain-containing protein [Actinomadura bangladeshensis]
MSENQARVFFGTELRRKREEAGLTGKELADALGCTPQWISTMESGRKVSEQSAKDLDTYFKTDGHYHRLWKLANKIEVQFTLPPGFAEYLEYEKQATSYRIFSALLINGLFQTEDYTRSILAATDGISASELTAKRMERQAVLTRESMPHTWLVLDEAVLRRTVGSAEVMREQLNALLAASERLNTMIQVVPNGAGYHAGLGGEFTILGFDDGPDLAYTESAGEGLLIQKPARIRDKVVRWDLLRGYALPVKESRALIRTVMESL